MRTVKTGMLICAGLYLAASIIPAVLAQNPAEEQRLLKAAFIYNFAKFTRWPQDTWGGPDGEMILCTAGEDGLVGELGRLGGKTVKGRKVRVLSLEGVGGPGDCHVLYVARSEQERYVDIVGSVGNDPVLTVSEIPQFGRSGGIIELYHEKDRIRFIINQGAAHRGNLKFSSRLLSLAIVIEHWQP